MLQALGQLKLSRLSKSLNNRHLAFSLLYLFRVCIFLLLCLYHPVCSSLIVSLQVFAICRSATPPWACPVLPSRWCNYRVFLKLVITLFHLPPASCRRIVSLPGLCLLKAEPSSFDQICHVFKSRHFLAKLAHQGAVSKARVSSPVSSSKLGSAIEKVIPSLVICLCSVCSRGS